MIDEVDRVARTSIPHSISDMPPDQHMARFFAQVVEWFDLSELEEAFKRQR